MLPYDGASRYDGGTSAHGPPPGRGTGRDKKTPAVGRCPDLSAAVFISTFVPAFVPIWIRRKSLFYFALYWAHLDSNQEPKDYESSALTVELWAPRAHSTSGQPARRG